jgi:hypothetical protein
MSAVVAATRRRSVVGALAFAVAISNLGYAISFLIVRPHNADTAGAAASVFLTLAGLLAVPVLVALYRRVTTNGPDLAMAALAFGLAGALGSAIHGGFDLANAIHHTSASGTDAPSQIDPRGLLAFGASALSLLCFAALIRRDARLPRGLATLAAALGTLLLIVYGCRLAVLSTHNAALVVSAALAGFIASPAWYAWLGTVLSRDPEGG